MASNYYTAFSQKKRGSGPPPSLKEGVGARTGKPSMTEKKWPLPSPASSVGFNRKVKAPVVKTYAAKRGLA